MKTTMTDQEINVAIAEACPNFLRLSKASQEVIWIDPHGYDQDCSPVDDLNAMFEAETKLSAFQLEAYRETLSDLLHDDCRIGLAIHATARQRAEAFLRTIGKWKE